MPGPCTDSGETNRKVEGITVQSGKASGDEVGMMRKSLWNRGRVSQAEERARTEATWCDRVAGEAGKVQITLRVAWRLIILS